MLTITQGGIASLSIRTGSNTHPSTDAQEGFSFLGAAVHFALQEPRRTATYARWSQEDQGSTAAALFTGPGLTAFQITDVRSGAAPLSRNGVVMIRQDRTVALIVQMEVDPARSDELLEELNVSTDTFLLAFKTVQSVSFHRNADRSRIVEYLQAESAEAMAAIQARADMKQHELRVAALSISLTADLYIVDRLVIPETVRAAASSQVR